MTTEKMTGFTSKQRCLDGGTVLERRLGDGVLLTAVLAMVSTKFDWIARATKDNVALDHLVSPIQTLQ
jgi:hypothetical protein